MSLRKLVRKAAELLARRELLKKKYEEFKIPTIKIEEYVHPSIPIYFPQIPYQYKPVEQKERVEKKFSVKGIELSNVFEKIHVERIKTYTYLEKKPIEKIKLMYPLIIAKIDGKTKILAYADIHYVPEKKRLFYFVHEPPLTKKDKEIIEKTIRMLEDKLDIDFNSIKNIKDAYNYVDKKINEIWKFLKVKYPKEKEVEVKYYIFRDTIGLGKIEPLMHDPFIEDISCDGVGIPIFVFHRHPAIGEIQTNIVFETEEELDSFVMKLAQKTGRVISVAQPLLDGTLPDGSRVQITYGKDIARKGSNFTIRKFTKEPLTFVDLIKFGTADVKIFAYLWALIETQHSILIAGGTATGKTTFLNSIALFIKPEMKIVSIEDTPELQLPHPNWLPLVARPGFGPNNYGAVEMIDLLKASLRQRPDYIIVGEVRGREAYVLFQAMATGHPGLGTIHADSVEAVIDRLISPPINLPKVLLENLDAIVFLVRTKIGNYYVRRVAQIVEIYGYDRSRDDIVYGEAFRWIPAKDEFIALKSKILEEIKEFKGYTDEELIADLNFRAKVIEYLVKNNIRNYKEIEKYIEMFYNAPQELAKLLEKRKQSFLPFR